jgi:hypothetical protein
MHPITCTTESVAIKHWRLRALYSDMVHQGTMTDAAISVRRSADPVSYYYIKMAKVVGYASQLNQLRETLKT